VFFDEDGFFPKRLYGLFSMFSRMPLLENRVSPGNYAVFRVGLFPEIFSRITAFPVFHPARKEIFWEKPPR
jgi:hypothetical protein